FPVRTDIDVADDHPGQRILLADEQRVLHRCHAAGAGTPWPAVPGIAGTDALDEDHFARRRAVRQPLHAAAGRPRGVDHPLELDRGDDIRNPRVTELRLLGGIVRPIPRRDDDARDADLDDLYVVLLFYGPSFADVVAEPAFDAVL